jgi:hypothetical protein
MVHRPLMDGESRRLLEDARRERNWKRWGPYLSERQWGTVREDYSADGNCWEYFPHDHARSRAYRWGEDGLLGFTDRECRLCFALALWNGKDPILKERLFGLGGHEGNHGEDVKELYFYLDGTPTHSYMRALYKYPHAAFPYAHLVEENRRRGRAQPEYELLDTGVFEGESGAAAPGAPPARADAYHDVFVEYAKASPDDLLIRLTVANRGRAPATLHLLPTLWYRNTWSWGRSGEAYWARPRITCLGDRTLRATHQTLGTFRFAAQRLPAGRAPEWLFTENETNSERLFGQPSTTPFVKDAFHERVVNGRMDGVNPALSGTKAAAHYVLELPAGGEAVVRLRLTAEEEWPARPFGRPFDAMVARRAHEAEAFHAAHLPPGIGEDASTVIRQARAGLLWSKQFYHFVVRDWLEGDPAQPKPPESRRNGRNADWTHLYNRDVLSMPDKWEYPWFAAWDLAFHVIPFADFDPQFAKDQLLLLLREWYMHPNGQVPAYEFAFSDVNPPVHAWACWRTYKITGRRGRRDRLFLARCFQKLMLNFTWWVNRKDAEGKHVFAGGFLGLDNIGVFDRSRPLPTGGRLEQADGTAWMAFYAATMLSMALELAQEDPEYEDVASKFFEHFVAITDAMNTLGGTGLWDEEDGFYYDKLHVGGRQVPLRVRSMVGLVPLFAVEVLEQESFEKLHGFIKRLSWFLENRADLARHISYFDASVGERHPRRLLAVPSRERLVRVLRYVLDEDEFLSPHGIRSLSRAHLEQPYVFRANGTEWRVGYAPGESDTSLFGGNSNWRGPVWMPVNYLLIEALERFHHFYGDTLKVEHPTGSGRFLNLQEVAVDLVRRVSRLFLADGQGRRPCHGGSRRFAEDPHFRDLLLFHEYFHGDTGCGLGASHQTGWTSLVARGLQKLAHADS